MSRREALEATQLWWLFLVVGLASAIAGVLLVFRPSDSLNALAVIVGIFLLIDGVIELVSAFTREANQGLAAVIGVLGIIVGLVLIRHPMHGVAAVGLVIGIWLVAAGLIRFVRALVEGMHPFLRCAIAALEVVIGIIIVSDPHIGYTALAIIAGIWLILNGIALLAFSATVRGARDALAEPPPG